MNLFSISAVLSLLLQYTVAQESASPIVQPADFSGEDTPYQIIPNGTDIPPGFNSSDLSTRKRDWNLALWIQWLQ